MKLHTALLVILFGLLAGCASVPLAPGCLRLGRSGQFCPLPPAALPALNGTQLVSVTRDGESQTFLGRLQIDRDNLRLAGLSLFGTELFTLDYDGQHVSGHAVQGEWHPELLLAMLELTLAPAAELPPRLQGLALSVRASAARQVRELREGGHLIARIARPITITADAPTEIMIPKANLTLRMTPLAGNGGSP